MDGLNNLLGDFISVFNGASSNLIPIALGFLYFATAFQIIRSCLRNITDIPFFNLLKIMIFYIVYRYAIENYNSILEVLRDTVIRIGERGAGVPYNTFEINPDLIFGKGYNMIQPLANKFEWLSGSTYGYGIAWIIGILLTMFLSLNIFIFYLEFLAVTSISIIFIPFLAFEKTDFLGTKVFTTVTSQLIRLMFYSFLMSICLVHLKNANIDNLEQAFYLVLKIGGITWLTWKVPSLIGAILNGSPTLDWNTAWSSGKAGFDNVKSAGRGGVKGVKAGARGIAGGYTMGKGAYNGAKTKISQMANFRKPKLPK